MTTQYLSTTEGTIPFTYPSLPPTKLCSTWYRIVGDLKSGIRPLVTLHGGPGASHAYLKPLFDALSTNTGRPIVYYDQIGTGKSTHFREKRLDTSFWTIPLFMAELDNLVSHLGIAGDFDLYGHSWGAMLALPYAVWSERKAVGLNKLILASGPATMALFEKAGRELLGRLPEEVQRTIEKYEKSKDYENEEYKEAIGVYYKAYLCQLEEWPKELDEAMAWLERDDTVYFTMNGPSELTVVGSLKTYNTIEEAKRVKVPTLLINGENDEVQDECVEPWFRSIPKVKWVRLDRGTHMVHLEQPEKYAALVSGFLDDA
ncbi:Alpha/Beta hydrolase protein [Pseudomassariella vexata]|uniref:Alpha/Beta hydrolase protein n=1 Tax=Pseudomassariella vexata TaxID=1141098 RepID=A0A1Y2D871_9PEZI|nr:Alpha/Beta hydrolase protein [Pseudomassariella vexata]ORY55460.1 Alpha/Beta hydrolase protein [Pseudomassariella vexata]